MENPSTRNILVKFREAPDYKKVGATGIYGGITTTGELLCHFYIEFHEIPDEQRHIVKDGSLVPEPGSSSTTALIRELQVGVLLPAHIIRSIGEWFIVQSNTIEQIAQANNPD